MRQALKHLTSFSALPGYLMSFINEVMEHLNPAPNPEIEKAFAYQVDHLPVLWLLGKTGAGKSSLVRALTSYSKVEIGNGFRPCTPFSQFYDFPEDKPLLRFLDTRGLAEADYNAEDDLLAFQKKSYTLILVMKAEDPEQGVVLNALKQIRQSGTVHSLLLVHTGVALIADENERQQCIIHNQAQAEKIWKKEIISVAVDFELEDGTQLGVNKLRTTLAEMMPLIAELQQKDNKTSQEENNFQLLKAEILWYAGTAGASDAIPGVGLVAVPSIQAKMLHNLGKHYGVEWDKRLVSEFIGALGTGFGMQYLSKLGIRQLTKLIPGYGQTVAAATAAVMSFCSTYAIGRVACLYLYYKNKGETVSQEAMQAMYQEAFDSIKEIAKSETDR